MELNRAVRGLAETTRKTLPSTSWEIYKLVDKRWRGIQLVSRVNKFVGRARERLKEKGESCLVRLRREASRECASSEAQRFVKDLRALEKDMNEAADINWQDYERRTLEIIVDDLRYEPLRVRVMPSLRWIACLGNPAYHDLFDYDRPFSSLPWQDFADWRAWVTIAERKHYKREEGKLRQAKHQLKLKNRKPSKEWINKYYTDFFATVMSEDDFVRKISR
jgi:hypothetical protein